ncbi:tafazzin [Lutzomyia longipalpis]|uniref:Tafazzin family protein n=2 Tax=Lutzomyia longipalpis TaxID=7200 RepID=A0A1B0GLM9_LUTLO|nr:tafazzin [Lutzomyia longipalpis]
MNYNISWIFPRLRKPSAFWHLASTVTIACVGLFSKIIMVWLNKTRVHNRHILSDALRKRPRGVPLITCSNHESCFDDPGLWGVLPLNQVCNHNVIRWSLAAHDICFTNKYHSLFFMTGKCVPCVRGAGVYQPAMDVCIEKLAQGDWVHVFPEGKVNMAQEYIRLKWGIGRLIYESPVLPMIIPIWHKGMETVLPNEPPYILRVGKKVTINFGDPIDLSDLVKSLKERNTPEPEARKVITDRIEEELDKLRIKTEQLHNKC